jgi:thymidylate synthase
LQKGKEQAMTVEISELDELQAAYKAAVDEWVSIIREEEALASIADHSVTEIDEWENAADREDEARDKAKAAKEAYENALREKFFNF